MGHHEDNKPNMLALVLHDRASASKFPSELPSPSPPLPWPGPQGEPTRISPTPPLAVLSLSQAPGPSAMSTVSLAGWSEPALLHAQEEEPPKHPSTRRTSASKPSGRELTATLKL